jgi:hypothetical protein
MKGFPIRRYEDVSHEYQGRTAYQVLEEFNSAEAIATFFRNLVSDPDSALVGYLAFIIRHSGNPIPF